MLVHDCPLWRLLATAQQRPSWLENLVEGLVLHASPARRCSFSYSTFSRLERCDKQSGGRPGDGRWRWSVPSPSHPNSVACHIPSGSLCANRLISDHEVTRLL